MIVYLLQLGAWRTADSAGNMPVDLAKLANHQSVVDVLLEYSPGESYHLAMPLP